MIVIVRRTDAVGTVAAIDYVLMFRSDQAYSNQDLYTRLQIKIDSLKTPETHCEIQPKIFCVFLFLFFFTNHFHLTEQVSISFRSLNSI